MSESSPLEQEIKIPVSDLAVGRLRLAGLGATLTAARAFEDNTVFDHPSHRLAETGRLLRLREFAGSWLLTFKGPARFDGAIKIREEIETVVADGEATRALLAALGFQPLWRYQKWREMWTHDGVAVALDETPLGTFVELEGPPERLVPLARTLGLDPAAAVTGSYRDLWFAHRAGDPAVPWDMLF